MKDLIVMFIEIASFYILHNCTTFIDDYPCGWRENTSRVIGVLFTFPFFILLFVLSSEEGVQKASKAFLLSFLASGIGTGLGWASDGL